MKRSWNYFPTKLENSSSGTPEYFKLNTGIVSLIYGFMTVNWLMYIKSCTNHDTVIGSKMEQDERQDAQDIH